MKKRLIITVTMCVLHLIGKYFASRSITFLTIMVVPPTSLVVGAFFFIGLFAIAVWNLVGIFKLWREYKAKILIPFALCLPFFFLGGLVSEFGLKRRIAAFQAELLGFEKKAEAVVEELRTRSTADNLTERSCHFGTYDKFTVYGVVDTNGLPTVRFLRAITMNFHHLGYMYRPDGTFGAALLDRECIQAPINDKWCAIAD